MCLQSTINGVILSVRAHAGGRREAITGIFNGALKIETTAAPERGKANQAIAKFIAKQCGIADSAVILQSGKTTRDKKFLIAGGSLAVIKEKLLDGLE